MVSSWTFLTFPESLSFSVSFFNLNLLSNLKPKPEKCPLKAKSPHNISSLVVCHDVVLNDWADPSEKLIISFLFYKQDNYVSMFNSQEGSCAINRSAGCPLSIVHTRPPRHPSQNPTISFPPPFPQEPNVL